MNTNINSDRSELLKKLHSKMNNKKLGRLNKINKEQKVTEMKEKLIGNNQQMSDIIDNVIKKTKKKCRNPKNNKASLINSMKTNIEETVKNELDNN